MLTYVFSKYTGFLTLVFVLISMKNVEIKKVIKVLFLINLIALLLHIVLYIIYLLLDSSSLNFIFRETMDGKTVRYSFFFIHPNVFGTYVFWTVAMYYYLYFDKLKIETYIFTIFLAIAMFVFPNSKTSALTIFFLIILVLLAKKNIKIPSIKIVYFLILILSIVGILYIKVPLIAMIDEGLTGRISIGKIIYDNYGVNLFGADISKGIENALVNGKYYTNVNIVDSMYYSLLLNYGIVALLIFSFLVFKYKNTGSNKIDRIFLLLLMIYGISETTCLSPEIAFPILFLSDTFNYSLWKKCNAMYL